VPEGGSYFISHLKKESQLGKFEGQVAVITGGALGIGGATARRLAAEGAAVVIADIADDAAAANADGIRQAGGKALAIHADVGVTEDVRGMIEAAVAEFGRMDILVQNAFGVGTEYPGMQGSAVSVAESAWDRGMSVLTKALYLGAKFAVPEMIKTGSGNIINIASVHSFLMIKENLVYEAGKSAVVGMTKQMAIDFGPNGVRVNAICPGWIVTEAGQKIVDEAPEVYEFAATQYPIGRAGVPDDIANAIAFLCSAEAGFITGHALVVDGGLTIQLQDAFGQAQAAWGQKNPGTKISYF
jgi:NAD(P)-dependent dehydrogenase (short-subunit alcohol dehydrogenase family)